MTPADVFPYAANTARQGKQVDHTKEYDPNAPPGSGQSRIGNYGPMTGFHHRIKTHGNRKVQQPFPGIFIWRDPHGAYYLVDHTGTRRVGPMSQLNTTRCGGSKTRTRAHRHSLPSVPRS